MHSTEERNATESAPHSDAALDILVTNLAKAIVNSALTPPRPPSKQRMTSLLDNPSGQSRIEQESQDSLSFPFLPLGLPVTEVVALTVNDQASTDIEEMVKISFSCVVQESQDSLSFASLAPGLPIMEVAVLTASDQAFADIEEMLKLQEDNAKLKQELQTL